MEELFESKLQDMLLASQAQTGHPGPSKTKRKRSSQVPPHGRSPYSEVDSEESEMDNRDSKRAKGFEACIKFDPKDVLAYGKYITRYYVFFFF